VTPATFSVVVPAFNAAPTITAALRSVLLQTRDDFEIAVVDDGSSDDTVERVTALGDNRIAVYRQERLGPSAARNLGIARTQGRYVCPLDADDLLLPTFLERMAAALDTDDGAGFAYTDAWALDDATGRIRKASAKAYQRPPHPSPHDASDLFSALLDRNFVYCCTLIRRSVLDQLGGYPEELWCSEDYELWLRIVGHGYRAVKVDGRLAVYREGQKASNSSDALRMARATAAMYERVATTYPVDEAARAAARAKAARWQATVERLAAPSSGLRARGVAALRAARTRILDPLRWHASPPEEVERLLVATAGWSARDAGAAPVG
jgi:glycosyltransferase involved in cell wall biosynthesis